MSLSVADFSVAADGYNPKFLRAAQDGITPLQNQVTKSVIKTNTNTVGNISAGNNLLYNYWRVDNNAAAAQTYVLTIQDLRNLYQRECVIFKSEATTATISIQLPANTEWVGSAVANGTTLLTIPLGNKACFTIYGFDQAPTAAGPNYLGVGGALTGLVFA